ncbi:hypothetical protein AAJ76_4600022919 [Vairimorpha ceranae]|uniref:Uncharacterized protein n=1 Tax=Vairimorpha ceranae TaxID=40302 RepID=A0A0F9YQ39_9MICR|nr:hypothetical protein AAJ76_4600022919 [Vairimorpha ceranae]KKO74777.1 hypothetical protein AAJ76_4600022919 [Vairimorpha ceranae]
MNLEKQEKLVSELDAVIESLEKEIIEVCKLNNNIKVQLDDMEKDELLTLAWISAYPKDL